MGCRLWGRIESDMTAVTYPQRRGLSATARLGSSETVPTQGGIHGSLLQAVPVPLPVFRTPPLWPMDADPWGSRSSRNGHSQPQWRPPTAHLKSPPPHPPGADPRCERTPTTPRAARFRPGPAGLQAGSQPHWRPPGARQGPTTHPLLALPSLPFLQLGAFGVPSSLSSPLHLNSTFYGFPDVPTHCFLS